MRIRWFLISLATLFHEKLMIGMELREKVTEYVKERILALRKTSSGQYENISVVRTNSMKYITNYFEKGQLTKIFFLFPDPHFKEKNHKRRVISTHLLDEYAYCLRAGGIIYTITDVGELGEWMNSCLEKHPMFESLTQEELDSDHVVELLCKATEEGHKVARMEDKLVKLFSDALLTLLEFHLIVVTLSSSFLTWKFWDSFYRNLEIIALFSLRWHLLVYEPIFYVASHKIRLFWHIYVSLFYGALGDYGYPFEYYWYASHTQ